MHPNSFILRSLVQEDYDLKESSSRYERSSLHDSLVLDKEAGLLYWNSKNLVLDPLKYLMEIRRI
jgi:hypothetical protein